MYNKKLNKMLINKNRQKIKREIKEKEIEKIKW